MTHKQVENIPVWFTVVIFAIASFMVVRYVESMDTTLTEMRGDIRQVLQELSDLDHRVRTLEEARR